MKKLFTCAGLAFSLLFSANAVAQAAKKAIPKNVSHFKMPASMVADADYVNGRVIFQVKDQYRSLCTNSYINDSKLQQLLNYLGVNSLAKIYPNHQPPRQKFNSAGQAFADLSLIYELNYKNTDVSVEKAVNLMMGTGLFNFADPRYIYKHTSIFPNDPNANGTTKPQYTYLNRVKAYNAWDTTATGPKGQGDTNVVIGIVDSGSDLAHPDLMNQFKHNYLDPVDGTDNDGDGYIDNYTGWDLAGGDYNNVVGDNNPQIMGTNNEHGSHVSGCASAQTNNGVGVAGIGWNCKLLPVKCAADNDTRSSGEGYIITGYEGITYAADHGANVINCSWGGTGGGSYGQTIITYASINKNAVVVAAAGNNSMDQMIFPAGYTYVMSVAASLTTNDSKASFSNWNYSVDITTPGNNIYNTLYSGSYAYLSGTSMASPITAGGAALVLSKWPNYTGLQAAQRLIMTADAFTGSTNIAYQYKMGSGRLNLYRALTDPSTPSVLFTNYQVVDHNDMAFTQGDTLFISGDFINYLDPTSSACVANISITAGGGSFISAMNTSFPLGVMPTNTTKNNSATPFTFKLTGIPPLNNTVTFKVQITDGTYTQSYFLAVLLNPDYVNIAINDVGTTITSHGKIGWNQDGAAMGLGFTYLGDELLYEGGLMLGNTGSHVSDCVRGMTAGTSDNDFGTNVVVAQKVGPVVSDFDVTTTFKDSAAPTPYGVTVHQNAYAWTSAGSRKFVIVEYILKNTTASALSNLYAGIFADWDIDESTYSQNKSDYDSTRKMGYSWATPTGGYYAGIKLLTNTAAPNFYGIDNSGTGRGGVNLSSVFSESDKFTTLSTFRKKAGDSSLVSYPGNDVCNVMSTGPLTINAGDSVKIAFALIAGDDLTQLQTSADTAQIRYSGVTGIKQVNENNNFVVYPNPATDVVNFVFGTSQAANYTISIQNLMGQTVKTVSVNTSGRGFHTSAIDVSELAAGTYLYKVTSQSGQPATGKIIVRH
jgi:subtilisin family serine protease